MINKYPYWYDDNGYIIGSKENHIERLRDQLRASDYQALKMWEAERLGLQAPYQLEVLENRQLIRDEINMLEAVTDEELNGQQ